jgi:chitin disaccharide deacetylase
MAVSRQSNRLLGYPDDARLLIINADDFGMCHAINMGILRGMQQGVVHATSLMMPCPWALHAIELLKANPDLDFGVHLTVICDQTNYKWSSLTSRDKVPSLIDEKGHFYHVKRTPEFIARAQLDELEVEFRAQIETVLNAGVKPSHLDWHCFHDGGRVDIFELTFRLAREYGLAIRVSSPPLIDQLQAQGLPTNEFPLLDSYEMDIPTKPARYAQMLRDLPAGLTEWAVHPAINTDEMQVIEPESWQVRVTDYDFVMSAAAREIIQQEGIILLDYRTLQRVWYNS